MNAIRRTAELNARELETVTAPTASWHRDYSDTAFIYVGGLDTRLSEGDVLIIFSQFGEPVWIKLARDKETGKSKGFGWLKYEDQRSCDLAVDNLSGAQVLGRLLNVDHTRYEARKNKDGEETEFMGDNTVPPEDRDRFGNVKVAGGNGSDAEESGSEAEEARPLLKEEKELLEIMRTHDDDDPMKGYLIQQKKEEIEAAKLALGPVVKKEKKRRKDKKDGRSRRHEKSDRRRSRSPRDRVGETSRSERRGRNSDGGERDSERRHRQTQGITEKDRGQAERSRRDERSDDERAERRETGRHSRRRRDDDEDGRHGSRSPASHRRYRRDSRSEDDHRNRSGSRSPPSRAR